MPGRPELQSGAVLALLASAGLAALAFWNRGATPVSPTDAFSSHGFASAVIAIMLVGVLGVGAILLVLGAILWIFGRKRAERERWHRDG